MEKKSKKASENLKKENKRTLLFKKAKELKINNYQTLTNEKLEEEIKKMENSSKKEDDISLLSRAELIKIAQNLKIKNYSKLKKDKLIEEIKKLKNSQNNKDKSDNKEKISTFQKQIPDNLEKLTKNELIEFCKIYKIKNYSKISKSKIIKILKDLKYKESQDIDFNINNQLKEDTNKKDEILNKEDNKTKSDKEQSSKKLLKEEKEIKRKEQEIEDKVREDSKHFKDDVKTKILFMPSKYGFGKTNEEYLLEDEKDITLKPDIIDEKDEITLMPIDPYRAYVYWTLSKDTIKKLSKLKIRELILKLNDVTGIIYNGNNANSFWFEKILLNSPNWYINMPKNNFNLCIELGYLIGSTFFILAKSNVVHIPTSSPSSIVKDEFVVVDFNQENDKKQEDNKKVFYNIDELSINLKLPILNKEKKSLKIKKIPKYFIKEYEIKQKKEEKKQENITLPLPPKLPKINYKSNILFDTTKKFDNYENKDYITSQKVSKEVKKDLYEFKNKYSEKELTIPKLTSTKKQEKYTESLEKTKMYDVSFSKKTDFLDKKSDKFYYRIPEDEKIIKIHYLGNQLEPYRRVIYYYFEPIKRIHEKIYKISCGPYWIKEFIGGSERIKFLGASEKFIGASDIFMGASEKFLGASNIFIGASEKFLGGSDIFFGASERYYYRIPKYYRFSEPVNIRVDKYIIV
jgi:hypothetical protein